MNPYGILMVVPSYMDDAIYMSDIWGIQCMATYMGDNVHMYCMAIDKW